MWARRRSQPTAPVVTRGTGEAVSGPVARVAAGLAAGLAAVLVAGCSPAAAPVPEPAAGGPSPVLQTPPAGPMDPTERQVAEHLAARLRTDGLALQHLDCAPWRGRLPAVLACTGWFDGIRGRVSVRLRSGREGTVAYDAAVTGGVVATQLLVRRLLDEGYVDVDCGTRAAYPATVGDELVCHVTHDGDHGHVVATVTGRDGSVTISGPR